ncbi:MAG: glycoside hydrolase family 127 protein, partial [Oscillospiraceae bacterium]|nr:glycoside hydrolase family 127 protein [Oscillospiraceae bacterium]
MRKGFMKRVLCFLLVLALLVTLVPGGGILAVSDSEHTPTQNILADGEAPSPVDSTFSGNAVLWLPFEDSLADISTNPINVTTVGPPAAYVYVDGVAPDTRAMNLSTAAAVLNLGTDAKLNPENLTASFWFHPNASMANNTEHIIMWTKDQWNDHGWYIGSEDNARPLILSVGLGVTGGGGGGGGQPLEFRVTGMTRGAFFPTNQWTHIAVTYDAATREARIFRNGIIQPVAVSNPSAPGIIQNAPGVPAFIGRNGGHGGNNANFRLDEFKLFDAALPPNEIIDLYNDMRPFGNIQQVLDGDAGRLSLPERTSTDLQMPTMGLNGSSIAWFSSNPAVISTTGVVTPPELGEVVVRITATLSHPSAPGVEVVRYWDVTVLMPGVILRDVSKGNVDLLCPFLTNAQDRNIDLLLTLNPYRFLAHFYTTAGMVRPPQAIPYEYFCWQNPDVINDPTVGEPTWERSTGNNFRGHMFGHYLTAMALAYQSIGPEDPRRQVILDEHLRPAIRELRAIQLEFADRFPNNAGYIGPFGDSRLDAMDGLSVGVPPSQSPVQGTVWVPWYNLHKVIAGLVDIYDFVTDDGCAVEDPIGPVAREIFIDFTDYFYNVRVSQYTPANRLQLLHIEYGAMNDVFYDIYRITGDANHRRAAEAFDEVTLFTHMVNRNDVLPGLHANTQIPKFLGALNRYRVLTQRESSFDALTSAQQQELPRYRLAAENFFDIVVNGGHSFITGGNSEAEHFRTTTQLTNRINYPETHETCNSYNMNRLARELFKLSNDVQFLDYYENVFINGILSAQDPRTGETMYFHPMGTGYDKLFGFNRFWCCTGTGIESFVKLRDSIYYEYDDRVVAALYFDSAYRNESLNLRLTQTSNMPVNDVVNITLEALDDNAPIASEAQVFLRVPGWTAEPGPGFVHRRGGTVLSETPVMSGGFIIVADIECGDEIELVFPMEVDYHTMPTNPNLTAFRYGPVVLSADLGDWNLGAMEGTGILVLRAARDPNAINIVGVTAVDSPAEWRANLTENLVRADELTDCGDSSCEAHGCCGLIQFRLRGTTMDDRLVYTPHFQRVIGRYGIYMLFSEPDSPAVQAQILAEKENLRLMEESSAYLNRFDGHAFEGQFGLESSLDAFGARNTFHGGWGGRTFRHSNVPGAWFSYGMRIVPEVTNYLHLTLANPDNGRNFDIFINDVFFQRHVVATPPGAPGNFHTVTFEIPTVHTHENIRMEEDPAIGGVDIPVVRVRFQHAPGGVNSSYTGGIFGVRITQRLGFDTNPNLRGLEFDTGQLVPAFASDVKEYTLYIPPNVTSIGMNATPYRDSSLVRVGNILIDDTQLRTVLTPGDNTTLVLNTFAQDHTTSTQYVINIVRQAYTPPHTISWALVGGAWSGEFTPPATVADGGTIAAIAEADLPTRDGFTFTGWAPELPLEDVTGPVTVTAQWDRDGDEMTFA